MHEAEALQYWFSHPLIVQYKTSRASATAYAVSETARIYWLGGNSIMSGYPLQNDKEVLGRLGARLLGRKLVQGYQTDGLGFFIWLRLGKRGYWRISSPGRSL
jgi:hypothetical protein